MASFMMLPDAVRDNLHDGDVVAFEGFTHLIPFAAGIKTQGPTLLITDLAVWKPHPETREFMVTSIHPGVTRETIQATCGWPVRYTNQVAETEAPSEHQLAVLRDLKARTKAAHEGAGRPDIRQGKLSVPEVI